MELLSKPPFPTILTVRDSIEPGAAHTSESSWPGASAVLLSFPSRSKEGLRIKDALAPPVNDS